MKRSGFTLLELVVVIFIVSLLAAVVFPSFYRSGEEKLAADARKIASLLQYLNDSAMYSKKTFSVKFDLGSRSIAWKGPDGEKTETMGSLSGLGLQSRGTIHEGQVTLLFGPLGIREDIEVSLRSGDREMAVMFSHISGRAKIKDEG